MKKNKQNLHVHSIYCDGKDSPEEMIKAAIEAGFDSLGFSIHSYLSCSRSGLLRREKVEKYNVEIERVKEKYKGIFPVYRGIEYDIYADDPCEGYEYAIASVHYLKTGDGLVTFDRDVTGTLEYIDKYFEGDPMKLAKEYYSLLAIAPEYGKFDIIGHFDLVTKNNELHHFLDTDSKEYKNYFREAIDALKGKIPLFEVNTGALARGYRSSPYTDFEIVKHMKEKGFGAVISSDCHDRRYIDSGYGMAEDILREAGYKTKFIFNGNDFDEVEL